MAARAIAVILGIGQIFVLKGKFSCSVTLVLLNSCSAVFPKFLVPRSNIDFASPCASRLVVNIEHNRCNVRRLGMRFFVCGSLIVSNIGINYYMSNMDSFWPKFARQDLCERALPKLANCEVQVAAASDD